VRPRIDADLVGKLLLGRRRLPLRMLEVGIAFYRDLRSTTDIALELGISRQGVADHLRRLRARARAHAARAA
jgi:predicted transcriptional regulator